MELKLIKKLELESIISWLSVLYALNGRKVTVWILIRYEDLTYLTFYYTEIHDYDCLKDLDLIQDCIALIYVLQKQQSINKQSITQLPNNWFQQMKCFT